MRQTMPEDRIIKRGRKGDEARLSESRSGAQDENRHGGQDADVAQKERIMTHKIAGSVRAADAK